LFELEDFNQHLVASKFHFEGVITIKQAEKVPNNEEKNQNWKDFLKKPFRTMAIMASFFFHSYECQGIQTKISLGKI
jgi:hypothetical protein